LERALRGRAEVLGGVEERERRERLVPGVRAGALVALEREQEDEADDHGEGRAADRERPRRALAVMEVAAVRGPLADPEHRPSHRGVEGDDDHDREPELHRTWI
jgi:hypothetical protein